MKIYSTGQVARLLNVANRTVAKWIDRGILKGYRLPGSGDRRVSEPDLVDFVKKTGIYLNGELDSSLKARLYRFLDDYVGHVPKEDLLRFLENDQS